jgi:hypothetical protein
VSADNEAALKLPSGSFLSVYPANFRSKPSYRLQITSKIHGISSNPSVLGAYATPNLNTLKPLFLLLLSRIFKASKARFAP